MRKVEFTVMLIIGVIGFFCAGAEHSAKENYKEALIEQREVNAVLFRKYSAMKNGVDCNGYQW